MQALSDVQRMISSEEFQLVVNHKRSKKKSRANHKNFEHISSSCDFLGISGCLEKESNTGRSGRCEEIDCASVVKAEQQCQEELRLSDFTRQDLRRTFVAAGLILNTDSNSVVDGVAPDSIRPLSSLKSPLVTELVCYGVGSFSVCPIARYQLALIGWLADSLGLSDCSLFEPRFTSVEKAAVVALGYKVIGINEDAKRLSSPCGTLFYMPHCDKTLYNNLLWANWSQERLATTFILGNSFSRMHDAVPSRILKDSFLYIYRVQRHTRERACPNSFKHDDIFNDMSLHVFSGSQSSLKFDSTVGGCCEDLSWPVEGSDFWTNVPEPAYDANGV